MQLNKALALNAFFFAVLLVLVVLLLYPQRETQTVSPGQVPKGEPPTLVDVAEEEPVQKDGVEIKPAPEEASPPPQNLTDSREERPLSSFLTR